MSTVFFLAEVTPVLVVYRPDYNSESPAGARARENFHSQKVNIDMMRTRTRAIGKIIALSQILKTAQQMQF